MQTAWYDDGAGVAWATKKENEKFGYGQRVQSAGNLFVKSCVFLEVECNRPGGALYVSGNFKMLIDSTSFIECVTYGVPGGGAICADKILGGSALKKVCAYDCACSSQTEPTPSDKQVFYIQVDENADVMNMISSTSVICSLYYTAYTKWLTFIRFGDIIQERYNISNNKVDEYSAGITNCGGNGKFKHRMTFISIVNNTARKYGCWVLGQWGKTQKLEVSYCNLINNQCANSQWGVIYTSVDVTMSNSAIINNNKDSVALHQSAGSFTLINCVHDNPKYDGNIVFKDTPKASFINNIVIFKTNMCPASVDSYGTLTALPIAVKNSKMKIAKEKFLSKFLMVMVSKGVD